MARRLRNKRGMRARRDRVRRPDGFTGPGWRELCNVALPFQGGEKRRFFNGLSDRVVVAAGVAAAVVGYGAGGLLGAVLGLAVGLPGAARAMARNRFRRG
jgi:type IV secretory pathway TrbD component